MSSLASLPFRFLAATVSAALAHSSHAAPQVRLRQQQQHKDVAVGHSHVGVDSNHSDGLALDYGDLTCMRWTGGVCPYTYCKESRGPTECIESKCMCPFGYCANAIGECEVHMEGEWLGTYAISFQKAYVPEKPYVGAVKPGPHYAPPTGEFDVQTWDTEYLVATADSRPQWKIALSPRAHVRFESADYPGNILSIYVNRRRRSFLLQQKSSPRNVQSENATSGVADRRALPKHDAHRDGAQVVMDEDLDEYLRERDAIRDADGTKVKITDDDDLWPVLMPMEEAHPIYATFRVRPTAKDGGGYEIWDPQTQVALSSANPDWYFGDSATDQGMAECRVADGECDGRQLVNFEPRLPHKATPVIERDILAEHGVLHWWQAGLIWLCFCGLFRTQFETCGQCLSMFAAVVVFVVVIFLTLTVIMYGCGSYCRKHPETVGLIFWVLVCSCICAPFCIYPFFKPYFKEYQDKTATPEIVETVDEHP